jgi:hypothetical protein
MGVEPFFAKRTSPEGREAAAVCARCPVREQCLEDVIHTEKIRLGIRGGLGPYERDELARGDA